MRNSAISAPAPPVKANDFQRLWAEVAPDVLEAVRTTGESGWYILGSEVEGFERELSARWGLRFAVGVASGLDAIEIGLRSCGCKSGDKVLVPPISAFATVMAVVRLGATPVFVDCDRFGLMDLDQARRAIEADSSIRYAVPVHLFGHCLNMPQLAALRSRFDLRIVEDCAQSIGASWHGAPCGTAGDCAATSFYPTKNLGAFGDGGALLSDSETIVAQARCLRDYGQSAKYVHQQIGYNSRLDEFHAAILRRALLPRLSAWTEARRSVARQYLDGIQNPLLEVPGAPEGSESCWHLFPVLVPQGRKPDFLAHLRANAVGAGEHYPLPMPDQPALRDVPFEKFAPCTLATEFCAREVSIPIHPYLESAEVDRTIDVCNSWK